MKILVVGDWYSDVHEDGIFQAYKQLGHDVHGFTWHQYFKPSDIGSHATLTIKNLFLKVQNKFIFGPVIQNINVDLVKAVDLCKPDVISLYRNTHITKRTLRIIKKRHPLTILVCHNEDDPFTQGHPYWLWRHFKEGVSEYHLVLAHRKRNVDQYVALGASTVKFLRSWYAPQRTHAVALNDADRLKFGSDVVFAGHYEDDGRLEYLEAIVKAGFKLKLFGPGKYWDPVLQKSPHLRFLRPVQMVWGDDYNRALCGAKIALCFFSRLNRDTYTRRCFEIPATKTLLLSEYSDELASLYRADKEALFFKSKDELIQKLQVYIDDASLRESVAERGYQRVRIDGHDVVSRMKQVLQWVEQSNNVD